MAFLKPGTEAWNTPSPHCPGKEAILPWFWSFHLQDWDIIPSRLARRLHYIIQDPRPGGARQPSGPEGPVAVSRAKAALHQPPNPAPGPAMDSVPGGE